MNKTMELLSKISDKQLEKIYQESKELQQAIMKERLKRAGGNKND